MTQNNEPVTWLDHLPRPSADSNKYHRGHALILAAPELTGATRLAASACSRIGAGLVSVIAPRKADIYRETLPADIMVREAITPEIKKVSAVLGGSGGIIAEHRSFLLENSYEACRVFDADALPAAQDYIFLDNKCVLTPHEGEFARIFPELSGNRQEQALQAAKASGAHIILKGAETVIASPEGRAVINAHASPYLAKAGTGDVLAGLLTGLLAQHMPVFEACCAATWFHGEAALRFGPGLVASDIPDMLPNIISELLR